MLVTRLEVVDGRFTGRPIAPVCYGAGKVHWATAFASDHQIDPYAIHFMDEVSIRRVPQGGMEMRMTKHFPPHA